MAEIRSFGCDAHTTSKLLEILQCYAEKKISQAEAEVARSFRLPRQTMNDYMKKLRAALEKIES